MLQGDDPGQALSLAARLREAGWTASVDLRGRNLSATRRAAQRQGYLALARLSNGTFEFINVVKGAISSYDGVPTPDQVAGE